MKKLKFSLMPFLMALLLAVGCSEDETSTSEGDTTTSETPTLSFQVAEEDITSVELAADRNSESSIVVVTNQEESTIVASLDDDAKQWCDVYVSEFTITLITYSENTTGATRTATVSVTVGEGESTLTQTFTAVQDFNVNVTLSLTSNGVTFYDYADQSDVVYITTNQSVISISGLESSDNFAASLDGQTITISTKGANEGNTSIIETLTVTVGEGEDTATEDIIITQLAPEAAKIYVEPTSVIFDDASNPVSVAVITNQANSTIKIELSGDNASDFSASLVDNVVTVVANSLNISGSDYTAILKITVGSGENTAYKELVITQSSQTAATLTLSSDAVEFVNEAGLDEVVTVTTNQSSSTISAVLSGDNADKFNMSIDGTKVTVTTTELNLTDGDYTATLTVTVGEGLNTATKEITITQVADIEFSLSTSVVELANTATSSSDITISTNLSYDSISAVLSGDDADKFEVSVVDNKVTVSTKEVNMTGVAYSATLAIESDMTTPASSQSVAITQSAAISLALSSTSVTLSGELGSSATIDITTNVASENISVAVAEAYADYFSITLSDAKITITALTAITSGEIVTFDDAVVVTLCSGDAIETSASITIKQGLTLEIGALYDSGIIFWIADDEKSFKIASLDDGWCNYATNDKTVIAAACSSSDGEANTAGVLAYYEACLADGTLTGTLEEEFPAFYWSTNDRGDGWYMGATDELKVLLAYAYDSSFTTKLSSYGGEALTGGQFYYGSNNHESTGSNAYCVRNSSGTWSTNNYGKNNSSGGRYVRAMKLVTLD